MTSSRLHTVVTLVIAVAFTGPLVTTAPADASGGATGLFANCKHFNARYRHGVGRAGAHDKTTGVPVTNFVHSTRLYNITMRHNKGLDRDHDGIACEKH